MSATGLRAFVAGATGYTGREVVRSLRERGITTIAHVRPDSPSLERVRAGFDRLGATTDTTPWTADAMFDTLARIRPTHVFALLGITRARARERVRAGGPAESYASVDYGLTSLLLDATRRAAPTARFIYLSALGVSDGSRNEYIRVRARLEQEIRASSLSALIVRSAIITGPDREESRPAERVAASVMAGGLSIARLLGAHALAARWRTRTASELADAMVILALEPAPGVRVADGETLDAAPGRASQARQG